MKVDIGIFLSPKNFSTVRISLLKFEWSENYRDQNLPCRKFQPEKRFPKILGDLFREKNPLKMGRYTIFFRRSKILGEAGKQEILACENIRFSSLFVAGEVSRETPPAAKSKGKRMFWQATNVPNILDLKSCSEQIFSQN